jgi:hypothetical protein
MLSRAILVRGSLGAIALRQETAMLSGSLPADDAVALAVVVQKLSLDVAQH